MAIYHLSVQVISRGQGKSCVAAAAYRAGEKLHDERQELNHDYTKKQGVESEIIAPSNSPSWVTDREKLWNEVDRAETRCNSRTAREINIALPVDLSKEYQKEIVREYVKESFVDKGMVADVCFHFNDENNPHCHIMLTTREIDKDGFTKKNREWDKKENVEEWRENWANHSNKALEKAGCEERIDHRSYKDQGIDQIPTIHLGKTSCEMEKKHLYNPRVEINNQIKRLNKEKIIVLQEYRELKDRLEQEKLNDVQKYSNLKPGEKAAIQKSEVILKELQTYENSDRELNKLKNIRQDEVLKLSKIDSEIGVVGKRLNSINYSLDSLKVANNELERLPKNMFGQYKDKNRAEILKATIKDCSNDLVSNGYKSSFDIKLNDLKLEDLQKNKEKLKSTIQEIDNDSNTIKTGVKALQNKELREFYKEYKNQFPQAKYLKYNDMKAIQKANKFMGRPVSIEEIIAAYRKNHDKVDIISNELRGIDDNGRRLINAKECIKTIDKYKDIADKWDTKVFGKTKFQEEHRTDKWQYDNAVNTLKKYGVRNTFDLRSQEHTHESSIKEIQPKLQVEKVTIITSVNILNGALQALDCALRAQKSEQRQENLRFTKTFKGKRKEIEDEMEL